MGQRMVQLTPGDLLLGHMNVQAGMGTRGEQLQPIVSTSSELVR